GPWMFPETMTRVLAPLLALSLVLSAATPAEAARQRAVRRAAEAPIPASEADRLAGEAVASGIPGISIAIAHRDSRFARAYGMTLPTGGTAATPETIFQIASLTKQFTAAAILALEEDGLLSVNDPITRWIPELDLGTRTVTLHHLLTHTSGLRTEILVDPYAPVAQADLIRLIGIRGFATEPGTAEAYNNSGYWLLGVAIERVTGLSYAKVLEQRFFVPLGLTRTAFCGTGPAVPVPAGSVEVFGHATATQPIDMSLAGAAGGICSTPSDLVTWSRALAGGAAISPASYEKMISPARLQNGAVLDYGYGLGLGSIEYNFATSHAGSIAGFHSYLIHIPGKGITVAVLANAVSASRSWARDIARALAAAMVE
ncbi:MAG TPA: serine hydrolase domain-containing protein, partial [Thermoanaerobaculia bacterium]|nr:serine hydrolase domain-containing protein [Thermoanaerobaculia bacterium]